MRYNMGPKKLNETASQDFLTSLLGSIPFGVIALDPEGRVILSNPAARALLKPGRKSAAGTEDAKAAGKDILGKIRNFPMLKEKLAGFIDSKEWESFETEESLNGIYLNIRGRPVRDGFIIVVDDITALKEMEARTVQYIITGQENDRKRLARDIHDGIGPMLASIKLDLDSFIDDYNNGNPEQLSDKLINIRQNIDSISSDLRDLSHHLMPRLLEEFGLFSAFSSLVNRINNSTRSSVDFYSNLTAGDRFDKEIEVNLYRCGQELLNNAVKHAMASEIMVQVIRHDQSIVLMVEDDGRGFERGGPVSDDPGIGLSNIEARVRSINGEFMLETQKDRGTTASIEVPLLKHTGP
jgi:signal transduction histidine kinase